MHAWADSSSPSETNVRSFIRIGESRLFTCIERKVDEAFWFEEMWFGETFGIVVDCPPIDHDNRAFGDEVFAVPVILSCEMVLSKLVDWTPSHDFLESISEKLLRIIP
jgi:hypothetical protein